MNIHETLLNKKYNSLREMLHSWTVCDFLNKLCKYSNFWTFLMKLQTEKMEKNIDIKIKREGKKEEAITQKTILENANWMKGKKRKILESLEFAAIWLTIRIFRSISVLHVIQINQSSSVGRQSYIRNVYNMPHVKLFSFDQEFLHSCYQMRYEVS